MARLYFVTGCRIRPETVSAFLFLVLSFYGTSSLDLQRPRAEKRLRLREGSEYPNRRHFVIRREVTSSTTSSSHQLQLSPSRRPSPSSCPVTCRGLKQRPVCGSDGVTYSSKCELRRLKDCEKKTDLKFVSKGSCSGETKCQEERRTAIFDLSQRPGHETYTPFCKADGSFTAMQCHNGTGYCWCVTPEGKPIPNSSVEGYNIDCTKFGKQKGKLISSRTPKQRRGVGTKDCSPAGRSIFNRNLIKRFNEEYTRASQRPSQHSTDVPSKPSAGGSTVAAACPSEADASSCSHRRIVEWKFDELDIDRNKELKRREMKTLRYLVNKLVEPHTCAVSFHDYCDWDKNNRITLHEWSRCLRVVVHNNNATSGSTGQIPVGQKNDKNAPKKHGTRNPPRVKPGPSKSPKKAVNNNKASDAAGLKRIHPKMPLKHTFFGLRSRNTNNFTSIVSVDQSITENGQKDIHSVNRPTNAEILQPKVRLCEEERQKAKEMDKADPDGRIFIPDCESNGLFKKAQCHNSTGYCWCVDDKTGIPIPGISTHNVTPDCSDVKTNRIKGCPFLTKKRFLTGLLDHITQEMVERANNGTVTSPIEPDPDQSIEERAVRWKMMTMDVNHNNVLERSEMKAFKEEIKKLKGDEKYMRKCRRNFLQYCDDDNDSVITAKEWVSCMGLNENPRNLPENPKRRGRNPFSTVLKS